MTFANYWCVSLLIVLAYGVGLMDDHNDAAVLFILPFAILTLTAILRGLS